MSSNTQTSDKPAQFSAEQTSHQQLLEINGHTFCVEDIGDPTAIPIIFIMGLACQMTHWPEGLLNGLLDRGYRVIRFDNRDIGLSEKISGGFKVNTRLAYLEYKLGFNPHANYTLHDMANDTSTILAALNIKAAHIVGASMGGMIGQLLAASHPEKVLSLTTIMSSTNSPRLPMPELGLMFKLSKVGKGQNDMASVLKRWQYFWSSVQSPAYPTPAEHIKKLIKHNFERCYSPGGTIRQIQAMLATGSIEAIIRHITAPTLIIHGTNDPLLKPACGKAIARNIKSSKLELIKGMGHDLPEQLIPQFIQLIDDHVQGTKTQ